MIQRHQKRRQAGFIRINDISRIDSIQTYRDIIALQSQKSLQFSPFKDQSPTPLEKIIKTYRNKTNSHFQELVCQFKQKIQHSNTPQVQDFRQPKRKEKKHHQNHNYYREERIQEQIDKQPLYFQFEPNYFRQQIKNDKKKRYEKFEKIEEAKKSKPIITQTIQEIHDIQNKSQILNLSLAEAFNLNCHKLKQKLERQRIKFSSRSKTHKRSKNSYGSIQCSQISKNRTSHAYSSNNIDNFYECKSKNIDQYLKMKNRNSDNQEKRRTIKKEQNKENCQENSNMNSKRQLKTARPIIDMNSTKFFIPVSSSRSKPITPRQAYQHSLKKWKQLPQVVARQKERERQSQMRQRLSRMKAHSMEVRNKLKK